MNMIVPQTNTGNDVATTEEIQHTPDHTMMIGELAAFLQELRTRVGNGTMTISLVKENGQDYCMAIQVGESITRVGVFFTTGSGKKLHGSSWNVRDEIERTFGGEFPRSVKDVVDYVLQGSLGHVKITITGGSVVKADFIRGIIFP
jgi:hypothetical protein